MVSCFLCHARGRSRPIRRGMAVHVCMHVAVGGYVVLGKWILEYLQLSWVFWIKFLELSPFHSDSLYCFLTWLKRLLHLSSRLLQSQVSHTQKVGTQVNVISGGNSSLNVGSRGHIVTDRQATASKLSLFAIPIKVINPSKKRESKTHAERPN